jgi:hypothetical protein
MDKKISGSSFNYNLDPKQNIQGFNMQSPLFGPTTFKINTPNRDDQPINQILINNNIINIQHTIPDPNYYANQHNNNMGNVNTQGTPQNDLNSRQKNFFQPRSSSSQASKKQQSSVSPPKEDSRRPVLNIIKPSRPSEKKVTIQS